MIHEDEPIQPSHISYKEYKKLINRNPKQGLIMFLSVFFVLLIIFLGIAKMMSPDVDITLGDETTQTEEEIQGGAIDNRLKEIQMEDNSEAIGGDSLTIEEDGKVVVPQKAEQPKEVLPQPTEDSVYLEDTSPIKLREAEPVAEPVKPAPAPVPHAVNAKVVVGSYSSLEQAEVAKGILNDSGLGLSPFIRKIGNEYTLQVGSYNSKEKAMSAAKDLLIKNYPARVLIEQ